MVHFMLTVKKLLECLHVSGIEETALSIGGRFDGSHSLKGAISALEVYVVGKTHGSDSGVPDALKNLIITRQ